MKGFFSKMVCLVVLLACSETLVASESTEKTEAEIKMLLQQWSEDFNAKNLPAVCGLFASDVVASFQGTGDRNYVEMCHFLSAAATNNEKFFRYDAPHIEQVIVDGDLAVVRLIWTLRVTPVGGSNTEVTKEKGLDVFRRQSDGSWKIAISYAYPL